LKTNMSLAQMREKIGQELLVTEWMPILQDRIQKFAEATGDHQWIHVDPERCKTESPFGAPIAHGFLTLSLLPEMMGSLIFLTDTKLTVNYGLNKVRFITPVPVGSLVRGRITLLKLDDVADAVQSTWSVTIERERSDKPVCVAESLMRHYL